MGARKYDEWLQEDGLKKIEAWARDGLLMPEISAKMGITRETLNQWRHRYPLIADALKKGKELADINVENSLYDRARGYSVDEVQTKEILDPVTGAVKYKEVKTVKKHVPADTTAIIYWLNNRKRGIWSNSSYNKAGADGGKVDVKLEGEVKEYSE